MGGGEAGMSGLSEVYKAQEIEQGFIKQKMCKVFSLCQSA